MLQRITNQYRGWILALTFLISGASCSFAYLDASWGAVGIAFFICPLLCALLMLSGIIAAVVIRRKYPEVKYSRVLPFAIILPILGAVLPVVVAILFGKQD